MTPALGSFLEDLRGALGADVVFDDEVSRRECSPDASPCFVPPKAVVRPRSEADILLTLQACRRHRVPLTPRAAVTSLSGAAIGPGVVLDTSRLAAIREFNAREGWVRVEPGVPIAELNAFLEVRGFRFPLEPGSREWCRIGGMIGHNASGYASVTYGQTRDNVLGLRVVLADGSVLDAHDADFDGREWHRLVARVPALETVRRVLEERREAIRGSRRPIRKHACGYGLAHLVDALEGDTFPLAHLFVGSEGTLGIVTEATLRILPRPSRTVTCLLFLDSLEDMGLLVQDLLPLGPSAIEGIDGDSLDVLGREAHGVPRAAQAMVLVEFDEGDVDALADRLVHEVAPRHRIIGAVEVASAPDRQAALWKARRSLFPNLLRRPGTRRPWGFVEDPIVPVEQVTDFIRFLMELTRKYGTVAGIYGHLGGTGTPTTAPSSIPWIRRTWSGCARCGRSSTTRSWTGSAGRLPESMASAGSGRTCSRGSGVQRSTGPCGRLRLP